MLNTSQSVLICILQKGRDINLEVVSFLIVCKDLTLVSAPSYQVWKQNSRGLLTEPWNIPVFRGLGSEEKQTENYLPVKSENQKLVSKKPIYKRL